MYEFNHDGPFPFGIYDFSGLYWSYVRFWNKQIKQYIWAFTLYFKLVFIVLSKIPYGLTYKTHENWLHMYVCSFSKLWKAPDPKQACKVCLNIRTLWSNMVDFFEYLQRVVIDTHAKHQFIILKRINWKKYFVIDDEGYFLCWRGQFQYYFQ